jgi:two-component system sensor histidine kinase VicK
MFLRTLQWRLVIIFILLAMFLVLIISFLLNRSIDVFYYQDFMGSIEKGFNVWELDGTENADEIEKYFEKRNVLFLFDIDEFRSITILRGIRINEVIYTSDERYTSSKNDFLNELVLSNNLKEIMSGKLKSKLQRRVSTQGKVYIDYAESRIFSGENYIFYFRMDTKAWESLAKSLNDKILQSIILSIMISLVIGYLMAKAITQPIIRLMHRAKKIAAGNFEQSAGVRSNDEIGKLGDTFNYMARNLKDKISEISSEKNKIETIINYMTDGIIAFNLRGDVVHSNPAAKEMLNENNISGNYKYYSEKYGINADIEELLYLNAQIKKDTKIKINNKDIRVYFAVFTDEAKKPEGIITVFQDITKQQKLDDMRRDFVANVSHELRTPLTTIKSYSETMIGDNLEDRKMAIDFLKVIDTEVDRMTRLVSDLLQLSRIDNRQLKWNFKEINFDDLVKSCVEKIRIRTKDKNQEMECFLISNIPKIIADYDRIEQVIVNILGNAIKYTPPEGKISVYLGRLYNEVYVKIIDTGIGIPHEDKERVFERFYRVDKARSRDLGGTGLGLSIAKEIIEAHKGRIEIISTEGEGTEVKISLPLKNR